MSWPGVVRPAAEPPAPVQRRSARRSPTRLGPSRRLASLLAAVALAVVTGVVVVTGAWALVLIVPVGVATAVALYRYPFGAVILWLLVFPFFLSGSPVLYWAFHRLLIPGALAMVIIARTRHRGPQARIFIEPAEWAMPVFVLVALVNIVILSPDQTDGLTHLYDRFIIPFSMYWLVRFIAPGRRELRLLALVAMAVIASQVFIGASSWVAPSVLPADWAILAGFRTTGSLGNVAVYSSTLFVCATILLLDWGVATPSRRVAYGIAIAGAAAFMVLTFSRGSWLATAVIAAVYLLLYPRRVLRIAAPLVVVAFILATTVYSAPVNFAIDRLNDEETAQSRIVGDVASLRMIERQPLIGFGYDTYNLTWEKFKTRVEEIPFKTGSTSHNTFLTVMAELGIPAFLFLVTPVAYWLVQTWRMRRRLAAVRPFGLAYVTLLWVAVLYHFTVSNFMDMYRFNYFGTTVFWMVIGLIAAAVAPTLGRAAASQDEP
jgi:O-Antigen ligase